MRILSNPFRILGERISNKFVLPSRYKNTVVEKWLIYWRGLLSDYKDVSVGVFKEAVTKPRKAAMIATGCYGLYALAVKNPNEEDFICCLRNYNNSMCMINPSLHNPVSQEYLKKMEQLLNQNRLRFLSIGICTFLWEDKFDKDDCTYPTICDYTRVRYYDIPWLIIDIGVCGHFLKLDWNMLNFDANYL